MRIGIDMDGVTVETINPLIKFYNQNYGIKVKRKDMKTYDLSSYFNCENKKQFDKLVDEFFESPYVNLIKPNNGSIKYINKLKEEGNDLFIITSRPYSAVENTFYIINEYFSKLLFSGVLFSENGNLSTKKRISKAEIAKRLWIDLVVDDCPDHLNKCIENNIEVLLFDQEWNKDMDISKDKRVKSWYQIYKKIHQLNK